MLHLDFRFKVLHRGERLYKFTLACAAQLVMWYSEREKRDEFSSQLVFMARCYVDVFAPRVTKRAGALVVGHRALAWSVVGDGAIDDLPRRRDFAQHHGLAPHNEVGAEVLE